jgi:ribosomal protein L37AE/L43A
MYSLSVLLFLIIIFSFATFGSMQQDIPADQHSYSEDNGLINTEQHGDTIVKTYSAAKGGAQDALQFIFSSVGLMFFNILSMAVTLIALYYFGPWLSKTILVKIRFRGEWPGIPLRYTGPPYFLLCFAGVVGGGYWLKSCQPFTGFLTSNPWPVYIVQIFLFWPIMAIPIYFLLMYLESLRIEHAKSISHKIIQQSKMHIPDYDPPVCPNCGDADPLLESADLINSWRCESCGKQWTDPGSSSVILPSVPTSGSK